MSTLSLTYTLTPNTPENVSHVQQNFVDVRTWANGNISSTNLADDAVTAAKLADGVVTDTHFAASAGMYSTYRTILNGTTPIDGGIAAGTYLLNDFRMSSAVSGSGVLGDGVTPYLLYLDDADYAITGRTTNLRLRAQFASNATAPAATFTVGLHPVTFAGGAGSLVPTAGTAVSGSTAVLTTPGASAVASAVSTDFAVPADGQYALVVVSSGGATAANHRGALSAQLQVHWT